ncbi:MAG: GNAT family N-acetyltransferase, partial [Burkholderiaceae bacterium]
MNIERLRPVHASAYRALMLEAYARYPDAFTASVDERGPLPLSWWEARIADDPDARELVIGAFEGEQLVGVAGLSFESRPKLRHKATLFGMYVHASARKRGLGRRLVRAALESARDRSRIKVVQLTVTEGNRPAHALYEECGFVAFGVEPLAVESGAGY